MSKHYSHETTQARSSLTVSSRRMSGHESRPPKVLFTAADFGGDGGVGSGGGGISTLEWAALIAFVGTIAFCTIQAILAPRRTFCATKMD
jgi:hypothetical protein